MTFAWSTFSLRRRPLNAVKSSFCVQISEMKWLQEQLCVSSLCFYLPECEINALH